MRFANLVVIFIAVIECLGGCVPFNVNPEVYDQYAGNELDRGVLATFLVEDIEFNVWLTHSDTILQLYELNNNSATDLIPYGPVLKGAGENDHNLPYHWHMDPERTRLVPQSDKACSASPDDVEKNLDQFIHIIGNYCPSGAVLLRLLDFRIPTPGILTG